MVRHLLGEGTASGLRVGIIVSRFNEFVTARLLRGAESVLQERGVRDQDVTVVWVPGALELPQAASRMARSGRWDALVALAAVIRGQTSHYDLVATQVARGINETALVTGVPVGFGVVTSESSEQAVARAGGAMGNRGADAAAAALEMALLLPRLDQPLS